MTEQYGVREQYVLGGESHDSLTEEIRRIGFAIYES